MVTADYLFKCSGSSYREIKRCIFHWKSLLTDHKPKLLVLAYHSVLPEAEFDPLGTVVSLKTFNKQIDWLAAKFPVISLNEAINQCKTSIAKSTTQVALTFDDGYRDNYEIVYPILKRKGLPATYFIVTDYIGKDMPLWYNQLFELLYKNKHLRTIVVADKVIHRNIMQPRLYFIFSVMERIKSLGSLERQRIIDSLEESVDKRPVLRHPDNRCMDWEQVKEMSKNGFEIGSHSLTHTSLSRLPFEEARQEIIKSKQAIEENLKKTCRHFAFPFGSKNDFNQELINCVKEAGFMSCLLNVHGYNHIEKGSLCFKRIIMEEATNLTHLFG